MLTISLQQELSRGELLERIKCLSYCLNTTIANGGRFSSNEFGNP